MAAGTYNFICEQYATLARTLRLTDSETELPIDLSGFSAHLQVRAAASSTLVVLDLDDTSGITLGGAAGTIIISVSDEDTGKLPDGSYVYDLVLTDGEGISYRLLEGSFDVRAGVTRPEVVA